MDLHIHNIDSISVDHGAPDVNFFTWPKQSDAHESRRMPGRPQRIRLEDWIGPEMSNGDAHNQVPAAGMTGLEIEKHGNGNKARQMESGQLRVLLIAYAYGLDCPPVAGIFP